MFNSIYNNDNFIKGIYKFYKQNYIRNLKDPKIIWKEKNVKLLEYGKRNNTKTILIIPSIINKYYILDLKRNRSLIRYLAKDYKVLVIDWSESHLRRVEDYIHIVCDILKIINDKINLIGHCFGGVIAIAVANLSRNKISSLSLIATPYDFSKLDKINKFILNNQDKKIIEQFKDLNLIPATHIWWFFTIIYFNEIYKKYCHFNNMVSRAAINIFTAVEYWINDNYALDKSLIEDITNIFFIKNKLYENMWFVDNTKIDINKIKQPIFIATAIKDKIVPKESTKLLLNSDNRFKIISDTGHLGMIVGSKAKKQLWLPLKKWLEKVN